ncbi:hypothetical protein M409DRAFT_65144 [Zasmidium cellare ATCC 36951]|uniref:Carboxymuconolactone decarboxylase-like domain-containing protein n=1 Tax=Zasmidium cellare ATCC 36951 TaxID=1080233 RepID=A0A6A6CSH5_ZASCE|nr:uncharacterized protein M409DRAFT_65144 [Zasmidium cellare ATCC 36951]KAF2168719.1 hypothetical protein M409DRAFT_65144 [Zasmidium cellare ATCC 36951]
MTLTNEFFQQLESLFPKAADSPWYVYAALVFQANDRMELISSTWRYVQSTTSKAEDQIVKARKMREALLKASVLVGFPKGINACTTLRKALLADSPEIESELDKDSSLRQHLSRSEKDARGMDFFSKIYAQHTDRVLQNMSVASGGDLSEFAINAVYGDLMAEESRLNAKETGLLEFLACYATGGSVWAQAKGHMYGSHNLGNGKAEIQGAVKICDTIEETLDIKVNRAPAENWSWLAKAEKW